jgi:hypothetical protein
MAVVAFLLAVCAANVTGPQPPSARIVAIVGLASWLLPVWAGWLDRRLGEIGSVQPEPLPHGHVGRACTATAYKLDDLLSIRTDFIFTASNREWPGVFEILSTTS